MFLQAKNYTFAMVDNLLSYGRRVMVEFDNDYVFMKNSLEGLNN